MGFKNVKYSGIVKLKEEGNIFSYGLISKSANDINNILNRRFINSDNKIGIRVMLVDNQDNNKNYEVVYDFCGKLFKDKVYGIYEWFIGDDEKFEGESLDSALFNCVGDNVIISINLYD